MLLMKLARLKGSMASFRSPQYDRFVIDFSIETWDKIETKEHSMAENCTHLDQIHDVTPSANGCEDCLKTGDSWVHLRICLSCGHVGCCNSSKNKHATKHFHTTRHPIMKSFQPGEDWGWCYIDEFELKLPEAYSC